MTIHYYPDRYKVNKSKHVVCGRKISWSCIGNNGAKLGTNDVNQVTCKLCLKYINKER